MRFDRRRETENGQRAKKEKAPSLPWKDVLAMITAAFWVMLPPLLILVSVVVAVLFLVLWVFR